MKREGDLSISQQSTYHTIIICRTSSIPVAECFPSVVFTRGQDIISSPKSEQGLQMNYGFNAIKLVFQKRYVIAGQGNFLLPFLTSAEKEAIGHQGTIDFHTLNVNQHLKFYLFLQNEELLQIEPDILTVQGEILLLIDERDQRFIKEQNFKDIDKIKISSSKIYESFIFDSSYALLSTSHFLHSWVRGQSKISQYESRAGRIVHCMDEKVCSLIKNRYLRSKL